MNESQLNISGLSAKHENRMIRLSFAISAFQILGMLFEYSKVFFLYPITQQVLQSLFLLSVIISFIFLTSNKRKYYKINLLVVSYCTFVSIVFSIVLFPNFYKQINLDSDLFFMRNMLFLMAYIGLVGLVVGKRKHILIQGILTVMYITFVFIYTDNEFVKNSLPLYYLVCIAFCWVMYSTVVSLNTYLSELYKTNKLNHELNIVTNLKSQRQERYFKSIIDLTNTKSFESNDLDVYFHIVTIIAKTLEISRASIWLLSPDNKSIVNKVLINDGELDNNRTELFANDYPNYFKNLLTTPFIAANDAMNNPATREFSDTYLKPTSIYSMLDCPIKSNTEVIGVVCCEQKHEVREWTREDILFVQSVTDYVALYLKNSQIESLFTKLEAKNSEVLDSIKYAKRLQSAILPSSKMIKQFLSNSFVLYLPKDIVAGDFYWLETNQENIMFAAADCTGHGVPGAIISFVCHNALNRAVKEFDLIDPGQILNKTREIVIEQFEKSEELINDGMDISLCVYNSKEKTLKWSGANSPILISNSEGVKRLNSKKQPIGNYPNQKSFETTNIKVQEGDTIYLYTDGFIDQFGGSKGKKMKYKHFFELVNEYRTKELSEQKTSFHEAFEDWKGTEIQLDDVCLIGIRF